MPAQLKTPRSNNFIITYKAELILLLVTFSWGMSFPAIKISLRFVSPLLFVFIRFFITTVIFFLLVRKKLDFSNRQDIRNGFILGIFLFLGFAFQTMGLKYTTSAKSAFITGVNLVFIPFVQYFIIRSKPKKENLFGGLIVIIGLYILSEAYISIPNTGDFLTLICAVSFAFHIVLLNKFTTEFNFINLTFVQFFVMALLSLFFFAVYENTIADEAFLNLNSDLVWLILYTSVFSTLISIFLVTKYQQRTTPVRAAIIYSMESIFAVFFSFLMLGDVLNFHQIFGAVIMFTGLLISEFYGFIKIKLLK